MKAQHVLRAIDRVATDVESMHRVAQLAVSGLVAAALETSQPVSPMAVSRLNGRLLPVIGDTNERIMTLLADAGWNMLTAAQAQAGFELSESSRSQFAWLIGTPLELATKSIWDALQMDRKAAIQTLRSFQWEVAIATARGIPPKSAILQASTGKIASIKFVRPDRTGRRWNTAIFTRTLARDLLLSLYVESYLFVLASYGIDVARVDHADPAHPDHGREFSITGETKDLPTFEDIRREVWHPNARALVTHG